MVAFARNGFWVFVMLCTATQRLLAFRLPQSASGPVMENSSFIHELSADKCPGQYGCFSFLKVTGKYAACINGNYRPTNDDHKIFKKVGNSKAILKFADDKEAGKVGQGRWKRYPQRWKLIVTGGRGACGRSLPKHGGATEVLRSRIMGYSASMPLRVQYFKWEVNNGAGRFRPQPNLLTKPADKAWKPIVLCLHSVSLREIGNLKSCDTSHLRTKFDAKLTWNSRREFGANYSKLGINYGLANRTCNKARPMVTRYLLKKINGKRVLKSLGKGRWKVDNSELKSSKAFLAYRTRRGRGQNAVYKVSGPYPGPKFGSIISNGVESAKSVRVRVHDKGKTCVAVLFTKNF